MFDIQDKILYTLEKNIEVKVWKIIFIHTNYIKVMFPAPKPEIKHVIVAAPRTERAPHANNINSHNTAKN